MSVAGRSSLAYPCWFLGAQARRSSEEIGADVATSSHYSNREEAAQMNGPSTQFRTYVTRTAAEITSEESLDELLREIEAQAILPAAAIRRHDRLGGLIHEYIAA
jgi:hypothetical protein